VGTLVKTLQYGQAPADTPQLHEAFEAGLTVATAALGARHPSLVGGKPREGEGFRPEWSPIDRDLVIGEFGQATAADVDDAVAIAAAYAPAWGATDWRERVGITREAIDLMEERKAEIVAVSVLETAKNRLEAFGEVEELIGLVRLNCDQVEENDGFVYGLPGDGVSRYQEVLRPYGVWGIIAPFNFPFALAANPISAALLAGNCVVFKPAHQGAPAACGCPGAGDHDVVGNPSQRHADGADGEGCGAGKTGDAVEIIEPHPVQGQGAQDRLKWLTLADGAGREVVLATLNQGTDLHFLEVPHRAADRDHH
jgi:hypothetical protein